MRPAIRRCHGSSAIPIYVRPAGWGTAAAVPHLAADDRLGHPGWSVARRERRWLDCTGLTDGTTEGAGGVQLPLAGGGRTGQYAALVIGVGNALTDRTHLAFRAHASRPMRISVQARHPQSGDRWQRSIYLDAEPRDVSRPVQRHDAGRQ